jgi:predicted Zn-dependent protease
MPPEKNSPKSQAETQSTNNTVLQNTDLNKISAAIPTVIMVSTFFVIIISLIIYTYYGTLPKITTNLSKIVSYEGTIHVSDLEKNKLTDGVVVVDYQKKNTSVKLNDKKNNLVNTTIIDGDNFYSNTFSVNNNATSSYKITNKWLKTSVNDTGESLKEIYRDKNHPLFYLPKIDKNWILSKKQIINNKELYTLTKTSAEASSTKTIELRFNSRSLALDSIRIVINTKIVEIFITKINSTQVIEIPKDFLTSAELRDILILRNLPSKKIKNINLFYEEGITDEEIQTTKDSIYKYYGINVQTLKNYSTLPLARKILFTEDGRLDGDVLWDQFAKALPLNSTSTINILLTDEDMYSKNINKSSYIFSRAMPNNNAIVISTKHLYSSEDILKNRLMKIVVRSIGVSVGLSYSSDAKKKECIFYQATTTKELDSVGNDLCTVAKELIPIYFESTK